MGAGSGPPTDSELPPDRRGNGAPETNIEAGEYVEISDEPPEIENTADGGALVTIGEPYEAAQATEFYANLAETIPEPALMKLSTTLLQLVEQDKEARKKRDEQYEEGIKRTGLGKDAPGGASFQGASKVVHPMLTDACIDFESRVIKELWPSSGPVKPRIVGAITAEKQQRADRKVEHMNWQLTTQIKEARSVLETTLTQVPLGGSQFVNQYWDHRLKRPRWEFVPVDQVYVPFASASFQSSNRRTIVHPNMPGVEFRQRIESGMYRDIDLPRSSELNEPSKAEEASRKVEGVEEPAMNLDDDREIYEIMSWIEVTEELADCLDEEEAGEIYPYLISIDEKTKRVLSMYRDWEKGDETKEPIEHVFEFPFIPWRGAYSIGFPQIIGGLSGAATGALRALLDSAHIANMPGGMYAKGTGLSGQNRTNNPTEWTEIEMPVGVDDIRKAIFPYSENQPSNVLFQLLGFVVEAARSTVRTSLDELSTDQTPNTPVGTTMARVEEGLVVFSAIHGREHAALDALLRGLHRLNRLYLPETLRVDADGKEILVRRKDYEGPVDIQPVSDPTIYSDQQRFAQLNAIQQRQMVAPGLYKPRDVEMRFLKLLKVPDPDELLVDVPEPHELNAVNENVAMALGRPVVAFPLQDHLAHLQAHLDFIKSPVLGGNMLLGQTLLPVALKHCREHIAFFYASLMHDMMSQAANMPAEQLFSSDPRVKAALDRLIAQTSVAAMPKVSAALQGAMQTLTAAIQQLKSMMPPPPMDPAQVAVATAQAETARKSAKDQADNQIETAKVQQQGAGQQQETAAKMAQVQAGEQENAATNQTKRDIATLDSDTALQIATQREEMGVQPGFSTGESLKKGT